MVITALVSAFITYVPERIPGDTDFSTIPYAIGDWKGRDIKDDTVPDLTKRIYASDILYREYERPGRAPVTVYLTRCPSVKKTPNYKYHLPIYCYIGSGWSIEQQYDIAPDDGGAFRARVMLMRKNDQRLATVFYLVTRRDVRMTPGIRQRLIDIVNRMVFRRSDLTVVRISSPVVSDSVEETVAALEQFARQIDTYVTEILRKAG